MTKNIDADAFIRGTCRLERSSGWKQSAQRFLLNRLTEVSNLQKDVLTGTYQPDQGGKFRIHENGHERIIHAMTPREGMSRILCKFLRNLCHIFPSEGQAVHQ